MSETNKRVVLAFIDAMGRGDAEAAAPCLSPDSFTLAKGYGHFAGVRKYDTILATIGAFKQLIPAGMSPDIRSVTAEGDRVVVEFEGNCRTVNGKEYNNQYCMVFTIADGLIRQVNEYFCTKLADEVLWPLVSDMSL